MRVKNPFRHIHTPLRIRDHIRSLIPGIPRQEKTGLDASEDVSVTPRAKSHTTPQGGLTPPVTPRSKSQGTLSPASLGDVSMLSVHRDDLPPYNPDVPKDRKPRFWLELPQDCSKRLLLSKEPQKGKPADVRGFFERYNNDTAVRTRFLKHVLEDKAEYAISINEPGVSEHKHTTTLWGAAMALAGTYHNPAMLADLLRLGTPDAVVKLGRQFGRSYFATSTAIRAVAICAPDCFDSDVNNVYLANSCRELLVTALLQAMHDSHTLKEEVKKGKLENGIWADKWKPIVDHQTGQYKQIKDPAEKQLMELHISQDIAAILAIAEGAVKRCLDTMDKKANFARTDIEIVTSLAFLGMGIGLAAGHASAILVAILPGLFTIFQQNVIDAYFPKSEHAKSHEMLRLQRNARLQSLYVARFEDGTTPTPEQYTQIRNVLDLYRNAEEAVRGLLSASD